MEKAILALISLLLISCIEYREELWLEKDGSGILEMKIGIPDGMGMMGGGVSEKKLKAQIDTIPRIKLLESKEFLEKETKWVHLKIAFEDYGQLKHLKQEKSSSKFKSQRPDGDGEEQDEEDKRVDLVGDIRLDIGADGSMAFHRTVRMGAPPKAKSKPSAGGPAGGMAEQMGNAMQDGMMKAMLGKAYWEYTVHFPGKVTSSNASPEDAEGNTVRWTLPLVDLANGPKEMTADIGNAGLLLDWKTAGLGGAGGLGFVLLVVFFRKLRRGSGSARRGVIPPGGQRTIYRP